MSKANKNVKLKEHGMPKTSVSNRFVCARENGVAYAVFNKSELDLGMSWLTSFEENGFAVVEDVFTIEELSEMKGEIERLVTEIDLREQPKSVFSTYDENKVFSFCLRRVIGAAS